jgi:hypothetical protein
VCGGGGGHKIVQARCGFDACEKEPVGCSGWQNAVVSISLPVYISLDFPREGS